MKEFFAELRSAVLVTFVFAVVCCGLYPLVVYGFAQALFHDKANGSLIADATGTPRGSRLIGQQFTADKYFHSRPSAAGNGYDAANSSGSNLGPTSQKLNDAIKERIEADRECRCGRGRVHSLRSRVKVVARHPVYSARQGWGCGKILVTHGLAHGGQNRRAQR